MFKWVFLILILLISILIITLINKIQILLLLSDFWLGIENLKNAKHLKKELNEELMLVAWHPKRWWNWRVSHL